MPVPVGHTFGSTTSFPADDKERSFGSGSSGSSDDFSPENWLKCFSWMPSDGFGKREHSSASVSRLLIFLSSIWICSFQSELWIAGNIG